MGFIVCMQKNQSHSENSTEMAMILISTKQPEWPDYGTYAGYRTINFYAQNCHTTIFIIFEIADYLATNAVATFIKNRLATILSPLCLAKHFLKSRHPWPTLRWFYKVRFSWLWRSEKCCARSRLVVFKCPTAAILGIYFVGTIFLIKYLYGYIFCAFVLMNLKTTKRNRAQHFPIVKLNWTSL